MRRKKKPLDQQNLDPGTLADCTALRYHESKIHEIRRRLSQPVAGFEANARKPSSDKSPEALLQDVMPCSTAISELARREMDAHMTLGFSWGEFFRYIHTVYIAQFGESSKTLRRANAEGYAFLEKHYGVSKTTIRLHVNAYERFGHDADAIEFLCLTDMQYLLAKDIGDDIVNAVVEKRKEDPEMSTRTVRGLIANLRQQKHLIDADTM
jgi:hypothetical protein